MPANLFIRRFWSDHPLPLAPESDRLFDKTPTVGLVIGTYASVPYIHLQLEARQRFYPNVPTLVHDDCSGRSEELFHLCREYGCDFESNSRRMPATLGDLSVFLGGLKWAEERGIDLLLKVSRRWIFLVDWTADLIALAFASQRATYSNYTETFGFGFRTECVGLAVKLWGTPEIYRPLIERIRRGEELFVESYLHHLAVLLDQSLSTEAHRWRLRHPMTSDRQGYSAWPLMGTDRVQPRVPANYLWHDAHTPHDYAQQAASWELPYTATDFSDPNQCEGDRPPRLPGPFSHPSAWQGLETKYRSLLNGVFPIHTIVEVGIDWGWSLFHFAQDFPEAIVYGIDPLNPDANRPGHRDFVLTQVTRFPNIELILAPPQTAAGEFPGGIDLLHINTNSTRAEVKDLFDLWSPRVRSGGCVLFHDVQTYDPVRHFFDELLGQKNLIAEHHGLGAWYKP
jgi:hypothetical protein